MGAGDLATVVVPTPVQTSAYTASPGDFARADATSGSLTVTLPPAPAPGTVVGVKMVATSGGHTVTVACSGADFIDVYEGATSTTLTYAGQSVVLQYRSGVWLARSGNLPLAGLDARYTAAGSALPLAGGALTGAIAPAVVALTDAASIAVNAALGNDFRVTLGGNRTMAAPSNPINGQQVVFQLTQDATGSRTVTWTSSAGGFDFGGTGAPTLTTTAAKTDLVAFVYNATIGKWLFIWSALAN